MALSLDNQRYSLSLRGEQPWVDIEDDNVDVYVTFEDGRVYTATLITPENIATLMSRYRVSGECAHGLYFWAIDLVVVRAPITYERAIAVVANLLRDEKFEKAFYLIPSDESAQSNHTCKP